MGRPKTPATDLAVTNLAGLNGAPVVDVARATLEAGDSLIKAWTDLEPIIRKLTKKVSDFVDADEFDGFEGAKLLSLCASVSQKVGQAATGVLRASEGQSRLALLMSGGIKRSEPKAMTEKQLTGIVIEAAKKLAKDGPCPVCHAQPPIQVETEVSVIE